jgi:DNA repair protein RecN (Recombination protein N)
MLTHLSVRHYALIEKLDVEFGPGLNIITGETGAGKSIIVGALSIALGERAGAAAVRTGAGSALVQAVFDLRGKNDILRRAREAGLEDEDGEITVKREIRADGRGRCFINGMKCPLQSLKILGDLLVDVHGQNEHQSLFKSGSHLAFIDGHAGLGPKLAAYGRTFGRYRKAGEALLNLDARARDLRDKKDFLEYQLKELKAANLCAGREAELLNRIKNAENSHKTATLIEEVRAGLDDDIAARVRRLEKALSALARSDSRFQDSAAALAEIGARLSDIQGGVLSACGRAEADPASLDELNEQLAAVNRLKRKYRRDEQGLLDLLAETRQGLALLKNVDAEKAELEKENGRLRHELASQAATLTRARKKAAREFDSAVNKTLSHINMADAGFETKISELPDFEGTGRDGAEFTAAVNPGEPRRPLVKIASGGEISRVMLAVKSALSAHDHTPVLVFDEIDAGIGGETAGKIGVLLKKLSGHHQVFCVTHLPQIARQAGRHYSVEKAVAGKRAAVAIRLLAERERVDEITRMFGDVSSKKGREHARDLVKGAV